MAIDAVPQIQRPPGEPAPVQAAQVQSSVPRLGIGSGSAPARGLRPLVPAPFTDSRSSSQATRGAPPLVQCLAARPARPPVIHAGIRLSPARARGYALPLPPARAGAAASSSASASPARASRSSQPAATPSTSTASSSSTSSTSTASKNEFAFLSDKRLSVEDKLFMFMATVQKKNDQELEKKMKEFSARYVDKASSSSSSGAKKSSSGGLLGSLAGGIENLVESAVAGAAKAVGMPIEMLGALGLGGRIDSPLEILGDLCSQLGGPVLAAACTAVGFPELAPVASAFGTQLGKAVDRVVAAPASATSSGSGSGAKSSGGSKTSSSSSSTGKTSSSSSSSTSSADSPDERMAMLEIQRMVEKQNQMFNLVSNLLKAINDTAMNVIANTR